MNVPNNFETWSLPTDEEAVAAIMDTLVESRYTAFSAKAVVKGRRDSGASNLLAMVQNLQRTALQNGKTLGPNETAQVMIALMT